MATKTKMVRAKQACLVVVGDEPVEYQKRIVRDRNTGRLVEIDIHELPPAKEAVRGRDYAFSAREEIEADHEAVLAAPGLFVPVED